MELLLLIYSLPKIVVVFSRIICSNIASYKYIQTHPSLFSNMLFIQIFIDTAPIIIKMYVYAILETRNLRLKNMVSIFESEFCGQITEIKNDAKLRR